MKKAIALLLAVGVLLSILPVLPAAALGNITIYDTTSGYLSKTGTWYSGSALTGYQDSATVYGMAGASAVWKPELLYSGKYKISVWNVVDSGNQSKITITVQHKNGTTSQTFDHNKGTAGFLEMGEFEFDAGYSGSVQVSYSNDNGFGRLNCVRYELVEKGDSSLIDVPGTGEEEPYEPYATRSIPQKEVSIPETSSGATKIYVAPGGTGDGTEENPFGSIAQAQEKVKSLISSNQLGQGIGVYLKGGTYQLEESLIFSSQESGSESAPVIWQPYPGETVTLTTGKEISQTAVELVQNQEILDRIPAGGRGEVYQVNLADCGFPYMGKMDLKNSSPYIFVIGEKAGILSRWPNEGYGKTGALIDTSSRSDSGPRKRGFTYQIDDPRPLRWTEATDGWLNGYWMTPYTIDYARIANIDTQNMKISGKEYNDLGAYGGARYFAQNLLEEIDSPGEWYLDSDSQMFYFYPYEGWQSQQLLLAPSTYDIVQFGANAQHIYLRDIALKVGGGNGVAFDASSNHCGVIGGEIKNVTGIGAVIRGADNFVRDCDISFTGSKGISISGGVETQLIQGRNYAENNIIHDTGTGGGDKQGITINGCGNRVSNNHIYNTPTHGINGGGMENIIEYNIIERTNLEMGDTGGIYYLNYGMGYGTKIRYNIVKDSVGLMAVPGFSAEGALGIYLDDVTSGVEVTGNLVMNANERGLFGHGGRNLVFDNNILINNPGSISIVKTGISKNIAPGGVVETNIKKYNNSTVNNKYPEAVGALSDEFGEPKYNQVTNNVTFQSGPFQYASGVSNQGKDENNIQFDELPNTNFTDFLDFDYSQIKALNPNFKELPFDQMGIYTGGARTDTTTIVFDNRAEEFQLTYPYNGEENVDPVNTLRWTSGKGGIRESTIYIATDENFENIVDYNKITTAGSYDISLDYGQTYYWRVKASPMQGYAERWNSNGVFQFTTMKAEDKLSGEIAAAKVLLEETQEGQSGFPIGSKAKLQTAVETAESVLQGSDSVAIKEQISILMEAKDEYLSSKVEDRESLTTLVYDDFTADTIGQRPFGLFFRSYSALDITVQRDPVNGNNQAVYFNDTHANTHYTPRYFDPQSGYLEAGASVLTGQTNGGFSVSLMKTGNYTTESGVTRGSAAKVVFAADGYLYADQAKQYRMIPYQSNTWYQIKIALDLTAKQYDVYVNGNLEATDVPLCDQNVSSVNQIVFDSSDGTDAGAAAVGRYYLDNIVVRGKLSFGSNPYLSQLRVNGEMPAEFDPGKNVYQTGLTSAELAQANITFSAGENATVKILKQQDAVYVVVVTGDLSRTNTYILKE